MNMRSKLTARQLQVLTLASQGHSHQMIADDLGISLQTVKNHLTEIHERMEANNTVHAVVMAMEKGLIKCALNSC